MLLLVSSLHNEADQSAQRPRDDNDDNEQCEHFDWPSLFVYALL
jgi:hypothetical protein